jgi:hypothetical protein
MKPSALKRVFIALGALVLAVVVIFVLATLGRSEEANVIDSFEACADAGHPIMESYPERCAVPGGQTFTKQY